MNHKVLELTPNDLVTFAKIKRPDKLRYFHFNVAHNAFYDADVVLFRETKDSAPMVMKDRYGEMQKDAK